MTFHERTFEIAAFRIGLYAVFLLYPALVLQGRFLEAFSNAYSGFGTFFFAVALVMGLLAVGTMSYFFGYAALLAVLVSELFFNAALVIFTSHLAVAVIFTEGVSSLKLYDMVARRVKQGPYENVSANLQSCFLRFRRTIFLVAGALFTLSVGFGLLPEIMPTASDVAALSLYAAVGLVAIALTALYLGARE